MIENIKIKNRELFDWAKKNPNQKKHTNPYLIIPDEQYQSATFKVLVLGKETNGWGESENCASVEDLEELYQNEVLEKNIWGYGNPFWDFYFDYVKPISENAAHDIGICVSNVALVGYKYGEKGYNTKYSNELSGFLKDYIDILAPDAIICFTGFGTATHMENDYLKILEPIFGEYSGDKDILLPPQCKWPMRKLSFASSGGIAIYGTRHPQHTSRKWKESMKQAILQHIVP